MYYLALLNSRLFLRFIYLFDYCIDFKHLMRRTGHGGEMELNWAKWSLNASTDKEKVKMTILPLQAQHRARRYL